MPDFTPGELLLSLVLGLLTISFGKWATRLDKMIEAVEKMKNELHDYIVRMERRLSRVEERVNHHGSLLGIKHRTLAEDEEEE